MCWVGDAVVEVHVGLMHGIGEIAVQQTREHFFLDQWWDKRGDDGQA